jgi:ATP-binding cassette subfamily F protein uup
MCERFLFTPEIQYNPIGKLSGGERRRLYLLKVLMTAPNVLILDEPTNDLDIATLTILEDYLDSFEGIVITVSHDRYFLDRIVDRIFAFEGDGEIVQYEGDYTTYMEKALEKGTFLTEVNGSVLPQTDNLPVSQNTESKTDSRDTWKKREKKLKFTYMEQKEYETIDDDIADLEQAIGKLDEEMQTYASDYTKLREISEKKETLENQLSEKMERWVYLNDLAEKIEAQNEKN